MTKKTRKRNLAVAPSAYPQVPLSQPWVQAPLPVQMPYVQPFSSDLYDRSISITLLAHHGATVVKVTYASPYDSSLPLTAFGSAKREPGDAYDPETGKLLATSRALDELAAKLRKKANGRIRNADSIRRHREQIRSGQSGQRQPRPGDVTMTFRTIGPVTMVTPAPAHQPEEGKE